MKVLLLNGSSNLKGCTYTALEEIAKTLQEEGIDTEIFQIGAEPLRDCIGCGGCRKGNGCVFRDDCVNEFVEKAKEADGFVLCASKRPHYVIFRPCLLQWRCCISF